MTIFYCPDLISQFGSIGTVDARSIGMAKTYNATTEGVYSIGINPANLIFKPIGEIDLVTLVPLPSVSIRGGTRFMPIEELNYFFGGVDGNPRYLTSEDKEKLTRLFEDGGGVFANGTASILSISYHSENVGAFGLSINDFADNKLIIPERVIKLLLYGNEINTNYNFNDTEFQTWWIRSYSISYANEFNNLFKEIFTRLSAGVTFKYINGFMYVGIDRINTFVNSGSRAEITGRMDLLVNLAFSKDLGLRYKFEQGENKKVSTTPFPSPVGKGFGFDIGFAADIDNIWRLSLSVTDIGWITWSGHTAAQVAEGDIYFDDITDKDQRTVFEETILGSQKEINEFSTGLPTAMRVGASYFIPDGKYGIPGELLLAVDINKGFNELPGNTKLLRYSFGFEWKPAGWAPFIRTGLGFGGFDGFYWAFGLGFDFKFLELHFGTSSLQTFYAPNSSRKIEAGISSRWKF